jgi:hypothetical protein
MATYITGTWDWIGWNLLAVLATLLILAALFGWL